MLCGKSEHGFTIGLSKFEIYFLVPEKLSSTLLGLLFSKKNDILIHLKRGLLCLPEITLRHKNSTNFSIPLIVQNLLKAVFKPDQQELV